MGRVGKGFPVVASGLPEGDLHDLQTRGTEREKRPLILPTQHTFEKLGKLVIPLPLALRNEDRAWTPERLSLTRTVRVSPSAAERRGNKLKGVNAFYLKAKARIWP